MNFSFWQQKRLLQIRGQSAIREQLAHCFDVRIQAIISFGEGVITVLFFAASAMNHLYLHTPENHISGIALARGYPLKP